MSPSMNSSSHTILTRPHIRPSAIEASTHTTHSRKTSNTFLQSAPLSTSSSSTLFYYAPLSSTTSSSHSSTISSDSAISIRSSLSTSTSHSTTLTTSLSPAPTSSGPPDSSLSAHADLQATGLPIEFAVVALILLGLLLAMAITLWSVEGEDCQTSHKPNSQKREIVSGTRANAELFGLGIMLQPAIEERQEIGIYERLKGWFCIMIKERGFARLIERWTNVAVSRARTDPDTNAEKGLLLPVRESEGIGSEKNQIDFEL